MWWYKNLRNIILREMCTVCFWSYSFEYLIWFMCVSVCRCVHVSVGMCVSMGVGLWVWVWVPVVSDSLRQDMGAGTQTWFSSSIMGSWVWTQVTGLVQQAPYSLSCLSSPASIHTRQGKTDITWGDTNISVSKKITWVATTKHSMTVLRGGAET